MSQDHLASPADCAPASVRPSWCTCHLPPGAVWKLHFDSICGVTSGQSVCLWRRHDDWHQRVNAAQFPAGASSDPTGGATGAYAEQCPRSHQVWHKQFTAVFYQQHYHLRLHMPRLCLHSARFIEGCKGVIILWPLCSLFADSEYFRESIRHEIRTARERFSGQALSDELSRIQKRLDSVELLTPDIVMNLLLSYRDIQVCEAITSLCFKAPGLQAMNFDYHFFNSVSFWE